jgi:hypothetical protein
MTHERHGPDSDPFWTDDQQLSTELSLHDQPHTVRMGIHRSEETYPRSYRSTEILPILTEPGTRDYFLIHPYILLPDITLTIGLYETPQQSGAIGEVVRSDWEGTRHERIGDAQAWYYRPDHTLIFWDLNVFDRYLSTPIQTEDPAYAALWRSLENYLLAQFRTAAQLATPSWEPGVAPEQWQAFLTSLGYRPATPRAFAKAVPLPPIPPTTE